MSLMVGSAGALTLPDVSALNVLVVEDAPEFAQMMATVLRNSGHEVSTAATLADAVEQLNARAPELVILDLSLPDGDGLDLLQALRRHTSAYVIVVSGRHDEVDKVLAFRFGADDYVTKPFSSRELAARVDAMSRRPRGPQAAVVTEYSSGDVVVSIEARTVHIAGVPVELTRTEFDLLATFMANETQVFTRTVLIERVWGADWIGDEHIVDVHIANLRKKLAAVTDRQLVRTVRGVGYGFAEG